MSKVRSIAKKIGNKVWSLLKIPFGKIHQGFCRIFPKRVPRYFDSDLHEAKYICWMAVYAFFIYLFIESFARITTNPLGGILFLFQHPIIFFYNTLIIFATMTIALLFKRRRFAWFIISMIWITLGVVNGFILLKRMTPFTLYDLQNVSDGMTLLTTYFAKWQIILLIVVLGLVAACIVLIFLRSEKWHNINYKKSGLAIILSVGCAAGMSYGLIKGGVLATFFGNLNYAYNDYGFPYCFINTSVNKGISKPSDYSQEKIEEILETKTTSGLDTELENTNDSTEHPNIIVLQMESFTPSESYSNVSTNVSGTPVFNELMANYSSGTFEVPACGAGTANTEFEVLTGISARFFGPGEYPYKGKLRNQTLESLAYIANSHGYTSSALHDHRGLFYNRNEVYANLGFSSFTSLEYMTGIKNTPTNWCKDEVMIPDITGIMQETEGSDFMHVVSVEGHGKYPTEKTLTDPEVVVTADDEKTKYKYEYYFNLCKSMDTFIGDLISDIESSGEPTIILIYGDHIPALDVKESNYKGGDLYKTDYVIWDNIGLEKEDQDIASYQAGAILLEKAGLENEGAIFDYQQTTSSDDPNYTSDLKALAYDMIYGDNYTFGGLNPFKRMNMTMGHSKISVKDIVKIGDNYYLRGENFTENSRVTLDGKLLDTVYLSSTLLGLNESIDPEEVSKLNVSQIDKKDETILSSINGLEEL